MIPETSQLQELEARVSRGDAAAEGELLNRLEPQMVCMVRRAMRCRPNATPLDRLIRAEIGRLSPPSPQNQSMDDRRLAHQVAQRICAAVIDRLRPKPLGIREMRDTVPTGRMNYRFVPKVNRMNTVLLGQEIPA
jgi:hypothetical protein